MEKSIGFIFLLWVVAMVVGVIIALLPVILYLAGFALVIGAFALLGVFVRSLF